MKLKTYLWPQSTKVNDRKRYLVEIGIFLRVQFIKLKIEFSRISFYSMIALKRGF